MSFEFVLRLIGMVIFAIIGARLGDDASPALAAPSELIGVIFAFVGALIGLIVTPWLTTRPARLARRLVMESSTDRLLMTFVGLILGLIPATLLVYPLSILPEPFGPIVPAVVAIISGYLGLIVFSLRARDVLETMSNLAGNRRLLQFGSAPEQRVLLDTSTIIDGRIKDIAVAGFLNWTLVVPKFVLQELQHVADSSDMLRRNRGKRGLEILREMKQLNRPVEIIDDDVAGVDEVDHKLIVLAKDTNSPIMTNDFNLNQIAKLQGVRVLNVNALANAVRPEYIPGETIQLRVIQEGKESDQGVGYLDDGTMVVIEQGRQYLDRTINVEVTRLISREAGKMYFARPVETV